jgi:predicted dehydrogenase
LTGKEKKFKAKYKERHMSKKVKWGVIGSGGIARRRTIPEGIMAADNAELTVVFDLNSKANAEVAAECKATAVDSIEALLASDIDAVYIATPANVHCDQVTACAAAGKHVMCEKPLGMSMAETEKMMAACDAAGVKLGTAFMLRFLAQHQEAKKLIDAGKIGKPCFARAQLSCWFPKMENNWRQDPAKGGGGSLMDMGGHCIDLLEMFFGEVVSVSCVINNTVHDYKSEDSAVAMLTFANGAIGVVDNFFCMPDTASKNALELYGSGGSILASGTIGQADAGTMTATLSDPNAAYDAQQDRSDDGNFAIAPTPVNTYEAEVVEFSAAILENRQPSNNAASGVRSQKVLDACYESARTHKAVKI